MSSRISPNPIPHHTQGGGFFAQLSVLLARANQVTGTPRVSLCFLVTQARLGHVCTISHHHSRIYHD